MSAIDFKIAKVGREAESILVNLFELYLHDMAEWFRFETLHEDGRYRYDMKGHWKRGDQAYLLHVNNQPAGFALVGDGEPHGAGPGSHDVDEFFVTRIYRHAGIAQALAVHIWDKHPGNWTVRVLEANKPAVPFWRKTIADYTDGEFEEELYLVEDKYRWNRFSFTS